MQDKIKNSYIHLHIVFCIFASLCKENKIIILVNYSTGHEKIWFNISEVGSLFCVYSLQHWKMVI